MKGIVSALVLLTTACATPRAPAPSAFPDRLRAIGTEPFWSIDIDGDRIAYSTADQPRKREARLVRTESAGALDLSGTLGAEAIAIAIEPANCSDGMSDLTYPFAVKLRIGERALQGCARKP